METRLVFLAILYIILFAPLVFEKPKEDKEKESEFFCWEMYNFNVY